MKVVDYIMKLIETIGELLGSGSYGRVFKVEIDGKTVALKKYKRDSSGSNKYYVIPKDIVSEIVAYKKLALTDITPKLISFEVNPFIDDKKDDEDGGKEKDEDDGEDVYNCAISMELFENVINKMIERDDLEKVTKTLIRYLCTWIRHGIVHRDIKPDNIVCRRKEDGELEIRVIDWGMSRIFGEDVEVTGGKAMLTIPEQDFMTNIDGKIGAFGFRDPVYVFKTKKTHTNLLKLAPLLVPFVDIWAMGATILYLWCWVNEETYPISWENKKIHEETLGELYGYEEGEQTKKITRDYGFLGDELSDLLERMMCLEPYDRITIDEIEKHPYLRGVFGERAVKECGSTEIEKGEVFWPEELNDERRREMEVVQKIITSKRTGCSETYELTEILAIEIFKVIYDRSFVDEWELYSEVAIEIALTLHSTKSRVEPKVELRELACRVFIDKLDEIIALCTNGLVYRVWYGEFCRKRLDKIVPYDGEYVFHILMEMVRKMYGVSGFLYLPIKKQIETILVGFKYFCSGEDKRLLEKKKNKRWLELMEGERSEEMEVWYRMVSG